MRAVFLDRDDTLVSNTEATAHTAHPGDLFTPALVRLLPDAAAACRRLREAGYRLVVVTNQAGIAEALCTPEEVEATNDRMRELLVAAPHGVTLDATYYSPCIATGTVPRFTCDHDWRKPKAGMILAAARELDVDLPSSWLVGDAPRDAESGIAAGIPRGHCLIIGPGHPLPDLAAAAGTILKA